MQTDERVMKLLKRAEDILDRAEAIEEQEDCRQGCGWEWRQGLAVVKSTTEDWLLDYKVLMRDLRREAELAVVAEQMEEADLDAAEMFGNVVRMHK